MKGARYSLCPWGRSLLAQPAESRESGTVARDGSHGGRRGMRREREVCVYACLEREFSVFSLVCVCVSSERV